MEVQKDFKELLELLNAQRVEYVVVGAFALAHHGSPRLTGDLDILVRPDTDNGARLVSALRDFGLESLNLSPEDFSRPGDVIQLGVAPNRVDILTSLSGVSWDEVYADREPGIFGDVPTQYIGRKQFVANKRAIGRAKDLADLEAIGEK